MEAKDLSQEQQREADVYENIADAVASPHPSLVQWIRNLYKRFLLWIWGRYWAKAVNICQKEDGNEGKTVFDVTAYQRLDSVTMNRRYGPFFGEYNPYLDEETRKKLAHPKTSIERVFEELS